MTSFIRSAFRAAHLYVLRRRQFDSKALRAYFLKEYGINVGLYSYGCFDRWRMRGPMKVGRYCSIASTVRSALDNHPTDAITTHPALYERTFGVVDQDFPWTGSMTIEDDVWIGHNVVILSGCKRIGRGAIVGAGAIVTKDVQPYTIVAGNPARKIRDRFPPDLVAAIESSRWWELSLDELRQMVRSNPESVLHPNVDNIIDWTARRRQS